MASIWKYTYFITLLTELSVNNDFHDTHGLFLLFEGLELPDLNKEFEVPYTNGAENGVDDHIDTTATNGVNGLSLNGHTNSKVVNGVHGFTEANGVNGVHGSIPNAIENVPLVNGASH